MERNRIMDSKPTQLNTAPGAALPVPVPQNQKPDAYERALTLMAGETAGSGGQVRVWAPQTWRMCLSLLTVSILAALGSVAFMLLRGGYFSVNLFLAFSILICVVFVLPILYFWTQCAYISADENGIAFRDPLSRSKVRYLRWEDVHSLYVDHHFSLGFNCLVLDGPAGAELNLIGYSKAAQAELKSFITAQAGLCASPLDSSTLVSATAPLPWETRRPRLAIGPAGASRDVTKDAATETSLSPLDGTASGELQVWTPNRVRQWRPALLMLALFALSTLRTEWIAMCITYTCLTAQSLRGAIHRIRRARYLTANQEVLGIVTEKGFRVVPWSSIQSVRRITEMGLMHTLRLTAPDIINIPISAYPGPEREQLLELITTRANLKPDADQPRLYVR